MPGNSRTPSAGELCVTIHSFRHNALPNLKLLRGPLRTRRSQNTERILNMMTRAIDSGYLLLRIWELMGIQPYTDKLEDVSRQVLTEAFHLHRF